MVGVIDRNFFTDIRNISAEERMENKTDELKSLFRAKNAAWITMKGRSENIILIKLLMIL
jgi:hypothetical protein